ncbi:MAG: ATP-binding cassette domain-containing protein [Microbacteriaceae bacterium]|nr:ATP-binding cassette domain-containing protein [Microbacteriaceae bacterium]
MQLVLDHVSMTVGDRVLFQNVNARVASGESLSIVGPSGVGKSTLLGGIAGIIPLTKGEIRREGEGDQVLTHWIFQTTSLLMRRTVIDNVTLPALANGVPKEMAFSKSQDILEQLRLADKMMVPAYRLSGGEKQRLAVARSIVSEAGLILADEPTASLDPASRDLVVTALGHAKDVGAAVIVATHDKKVAESCDRLLDLEIM